jgi:acetyl-CoA C-acetyltransferase
VQLRDNRESNMGNFDVGAPVIIGVGEASRKTVAGEWPAPRELAGAAIKAALGDTGQPQAIAAAIDTIAAIRTFEDSGVSLGTGSPDNTPEAFGAAGGVTAQRLIYADVGGQSPQAMLNELAGDLRRGTLEVAVLVAAEATGTAKRARKAGVTLDWSLPSDTPFDNRLSSFPILSRTEIRHGIISMPLAYSMIENARRMALGFDADAYAGEMAALWSAFSAKAETRAHAQYPGFRSPDALQSDDNGNYPLTDIYRRWHVAQDAVDLGGAVILTSAGKARELGVPQNKWVWLAGTAEAAEPPLSERAVIHRSAALDFAIPAALNQAGLAAADLGPVDIYSCFPCAVFAAVDSMQDAGRALGDYTLTGGLSFFGGPGNGYGMYNIAAMVDALRRDGSKPALVTANGGVMSKQAVGIYTATQPTIAWSGDVAKSYAPIPHALDDAPHGKARVRSFVRSAGKDGFGPATLLLETEGGARAMAVMDGPVDADLGDAVVHVTPGEKRHVATFI